jgi:hypothetical protein
VLATFTSWDLDGSGSLSKAEFSAISQVGGAVMEAPREATPAMLAGGHGMCSGVRCPCFAHAACLTPVLCAVRGCCVTANATGRHERAVHITCV